MRSFTITAEFLLNVCGRYRVADIDLWPISTSLVADMVFCVADMVVTDIWFMADIDVIPLAHPWIS